MTVIEGISMAINNLMNINVPVGLTESIGIPVFRTAGLLNDVLNAMNRHDQEQEKTAGAEGSEGTGMPRGEEAEAAAADDDFEIENVRYISGAEEAEQNEISGAEEAEQN